MRSNPMLMLTTLLWKYDANHHKWKQKLFSSSVLVSCDHDTFIQAFSEPWWCSLANLRCGFLSEGALWGLVQIYFYSNQSQQWFPQRALKTETISLCVCLNKQIISVMEVEVLPCSVCDSASAPQFDWTSGPRTVTNELPRLVSATFSGATWLNWTEERQPMKPLEAPCITSSSKFSIPAKTQPSSEKGFWLRRSWTRRIDYRDLLVTLPNVSDRMRISSASDDSVYFLWTSWSIWLDRKKSDNKVITRNSKQGSSSSCVHCSLTWNQLCLQVALKGVWPGSSVTSSWLRIIA